MTIFWFDLPAGDTELELFGEGGEPLTFAAR
jgi:hypothetical protein